MKKIFFILCGSLLLFAACKNKTKQNGNDAPAVTSAQNNDYLVSMDGIGALTTEMSQQELEQLLNRKLPLMNPTDTVSGSWEDTATIHYKDAAIKLDFVRTYIKDDSFYMRVTGMQTSHPACKTKNGIGIGSTKQQIIDGFENYLLIMTPDYADTTYTTRSTSMYSIKVREDWEGKEMIFYLKDNKVYLLEVTSFHDDSE